MALLPSDLVTRSILPLYFSNNNNNVVINVKNKFNKDFGINIGEIQKLATELQKLTLEQQQLLEEKSTLEKGLLEAKEELAAAEMSVKELYIDTKELDININELNVIIEGLKNETDDDSKEEYVVDTYLNCKKYTSKNYWDYK